MSGLRRSQIDSLRSFSIATLLHSVLSGLALVFRAWDLFRPDVGVFRFRLLSLLRVFSEHINPISEPSASFQITANMPSRTLPTFTLAEVESHNNEKSCYVTVGKSVYDVTDFLDSHPGGADLVLEYAGKDVTEILKDEASHTHTEAAYDVLDDSLVGFLASKVAANGKAVNGKAVSTTVDEEELNGNGESVHPRTGMSRPEDLEKETDYDSDYKKHKFLDLSRPLFPQVWFGGFTKEFYLDQVHRPRHYKGGQSAPLFGNFLEPLTKTPWWIVPTLWWPPICYGTYLASQGFDNKLYLVAYWIFGVFFWSLIEYTLHRFLFHLD